jgi:LacI family transcriptional regulator
MRRITLQDVAARVGLNASTVSRSIHDNPRIPVETRQRVKTACEELGYRQSHVLSELASLRWNSDKVEIGTIVAYIVRTRRGDIFGTGLIDVLSKQGLVFGYKVEVFYREDFPSSAKLQSLLRSRGITEVLLGPTYDDSYAVEFDWSKFICVQLLPGFVRLPLHSVATDHFEGVVLAWQTAVNYGYKRIAVTLMDHPFFLLDDIKRESAVYACQRHLSPDLVVIPPFHHAPRESRSKEFTDWVKAYRPDVILDFNSKYYTVCCAEFGDIAYAVLNADLDNIAGVSVPTDALGKEGIHLLDYCRRTHQWGVPEERIDHVVEPKWFDGVTLPKKTS